MALPQEQCKRFANACDPLGDYKPAVQITNRKECPGTHAKSQPRMFAYQGTANEFLSIPIELHTGLLRQVTNGSRVDKRSWNPDISSSWLDRTYSTNRNISNIVYKSVSWKYKSNQFLFSCGLPVDLIRIVLVGASKISTGKSYSLVTVTDRFPYTNSKSES